MFYVNMSRIFIDLITITLPNNKTPNAAKNKISGGYC